MNHGAQEMSGKDPGHGEPDDAHERELIDLEFQSMVEGLSLDESSPTTYLDELDKFEDQNRFQPPAPPKVGLGETFKRAINSIKNWKNGPTFRDDDGAAL
ncbi:hypothetical protein [Candidatus Planktophila lacus]|uniref:hypothetical protein n=1 Tax=Candidatus Planktophila lacus TaxID=1884913 RepID=UPI00123707C2|nr:hypothetical protein [Candidatus Planktophila lacus]